MASTTTIRDRNRGTEMADIMGLMKQAQALQERMAEVQKDLESLEVEGALAAGSCA